MSAPSSSNPMTDDYAALAELAGGFIHEIKNHLSTLGLNLQLLAEDFQDPQTQRERRALTKISTVQRECQRLPACDGGCGAWISSQRTGRPAAGENAGREPTPVHAKSPGRSV